MIEIGTNLANILGGVIFAAVVIVFIWRMPR